MENESQNIVTKKLHPEEALLSWDAPEFIDHDRDVKWYLSAVVLGIGLLAYSLFTRDWYFIVILVIVVPVAFKYLHIKPELKRYGISRVGITVDERLYSFDEIHSFWIVYQPPVKTLDILSTRKYFPNLTIQLGDQDPVIVKNILKKYIPEQEKRGEAFMDKVTRIIKF